MSEHHGGRTWALAGAFVLAIGLIAASLGSPGQSKSTSSHATPRREQEWNRHGASTFRNHHAVTGKGRAIAFKEVVRVSCRVHDPSIMSVVPDGYWYRIASKPWDNKYFVAANTFLNGDPPGGPYTHNTDFKVPVCPKGT